jgi:hypothetical protein
MSRASPAFSVKSPPSVPCLGWTAAAFGSNMQPWVRPVHVGCRQRGAQAINLGCCSALLPFGAAALGIKASTTGIFMGSTREDVIHVLM